MIFMRTMNASKFKEKCLSLLDNLSPEGIVVTKRGRPVARLIPIDRDCAALIGCLKSKIKVKGNILTTGVDWDAQS